MDSVYAPLVPLSCVWLTRPTSIVMSCDKCPTLAIGIAYHRMRHGTRTVQQQYSVRSAACTKVFTSVAVLSSYVASNLLGGVVRSDVLAT